VSFGETRGHELRGPHYAVIIQSEAYPLSTVLIVPLSSSVRATEWRVPIDVNGQRTYALVEQLRAVDRARLKERVGSIAGASELTIIEEELALILGIHPMYRDADE
jgi:mRNA interferase MazF